MAGPPTRKPSHRDPQSDGDADSSFTGVFAELEQRDYDLLVDPESVYLEHLETIERIAVFVARRGHLNADETAEFVQIARVRLFENDYAIIRKFAAKASFSTYLSIVIHRLFHQVRVEQWGKWRPSAEAKRLGELAITLERLVTRDNFTFAEAAKILTVRTSPTCTVEDLEGLYIRLPLRNPRPVLVSGDGLPDAVAVEGDADERIKARDRAATARAAAHVAETVLQNMDPEDRLILKMRFWNSRKVPDIAAMLQIDQRTVYLRLEKLFAQLRASLELAGVGRAEIEALLSSGDVPVSLAPNSSDDPFSKSSRPSNDAVADRKREKKDDL